MKLIIFGATGTVGRQLVVQALAADHQVSAFSRTPAKLKRQHENLTLVAGDVLDRDRVAKAIEGHDGVLIALGAGRKGVVRSVGTKNIIEAMGRASVQRLICQTTLGAGESYQSLNFFWKYLMFGLLLRPALADHNQQEDHIRASNLDWTIVRPAAFTDGAQTNMFRHGFSPNDKNLNFKISRADVAAFMLEQLESEAYVRKTPGLSYAA